MRRLSDDRGATAVVVAITLAMLFGFAGFAVDVGALYQERRELQVGAEAGALAIAEDCGLGVAPCDTGYATGTAQGYADSNATDGLAGVDGVDLNLAGQTVTVYTSTVDADAAPTIFEPYFAQVIGFNGATVTAQASATWGYPSSLTTLPLIISDCEWNSYSGYVQPDDGSWEGDPALFTFHDGRALDGSPTPNCPVGSSGYDADGSGDLEGGFGWLNTTSGCEAELGTGDWVYDDPGASPSTGCNATTLYNLIFNKVVLIPYFDDVNDLGGSNGQYHVSGFGAIYVTGYNFGGQFKTPTASTAPCSGDVRCIAGYLTTTTVYDGELGGEDRGVVVVLLTG
jgi:Flp pilus assembly protein TadG